MERKEENPKLEQSAVRLQTATLSTIYNIVLQIVLRIVTFVANAFILRYISKDILGVINVRLLLLYTTIQFISREPFRRTCAPNPDETEDKNNTEKPKWQEIVNVNWLTVPATLIVGLFFSSIWYTCFERPDPNFVFYYGYGIFAIYFAIIIESLSESFYIYGQRNDFIRLKVAIEGIFQLTRCLLLSLIVYLSPQNAILGFAFAQIVASSVYCLCYVCYFVIAKQIPLANFIPEYLKRKQTSNSYFNLTLIQTSFSFLKNTAVKQFLTEGERYIMTVFAVIDFAEQGIYDVINNLGSLPARLIFQQIEENGYLMFSSMIKREIEPQKQKQKIIDSLNICSNLVKIMFLIGLLLLTYGYNCADLGLFLYGGRNLVEKEYGRIAIQLLHWHCIYIVFIALNGILECYSFAVMNTKQINRFNYKMLTISIIFLFLSLGLTSHFGSQGFIIANCFNISARIVISLHFISQIISITIPNYSIVNFIGRSSPNVVVLLSFVIMFMLLKIVRAIIFSESSLADSSPISKLIFIVTTGIIGLSHLAIIYFFQTDLVHFVRTNLLPRRGFKSKTS